MYLFFFLRSGKKINKNKVTAAEHRRTCVHRTHGPHPRPITSHHHKIFDYLKSVILLGQHFHGSRHEIARRSLFGTTGQLDGPGLDSTMNQFKYVGKFWKTIESAHPQGTMLMPILDIVNDLAVYSQYLTVLSIWQYTLTHFFLSLTLRLYEADP